MQKNVQPVLEAFNGRRLIPAAGGASVGFGKERSAFPASEDCLIYIPVDSRGAKITWNGAPAKTAASYVYIVLSENGVYPVRLADDLVFRDKSGDKNRFMVLSSNLLASAGAPSAAGSAYETRDSFLKFPSGLVVALPWLAQVARGKLPETGEMTSFAYGWLPLIHYSTGKKIAYDSQIPLILINPNLSVFVQSLPATTNVTGSLYEHFARPGKMPDWPQTRTVETTVMRQLSMQHTVEITYAFDWAQFFKIDALYYHNRRYAVRFAGEQVRLLDAEAGEALEELIRSPKYVVFFKEFSEMAIADRITRQDGFEYGAFFQSFMSTPTMQPLAKVARRRVALN